MSYLIDFNPNVASAGNDRLFLRTACENRERRNISPDGASWSANRATTGRGHEERFPSRRLRVRIGSNPAGLSVAKEGAIGTQATPSGPH